MKTTKDLICINCPMGCMLEVEFDEKGIISVKGQGCKKGELYAAKEVLNPRRTVTSIIPVIGGSEEMVSVKTATDIPKDKIKECVIALKGLTVKAPVEIGQIIVSNICGTGVDVVATKRVLKNR